MSRVAIDIGAKEDTGYDEPETSTKKCKKTMMMKNFIRKDGGWQLAVILLAVFCGNLLLQYMENTARAEQFGSPNSIAMAIGAANAGIYFAFGYFFIRLYLDPYHTVIDMIAFGGPVVRGILTIIVMFVARIFGAMIAFGQVGEARFENAAVVPNTAYTVFQAFLVEWLLASVIYLIVLGFGYMSREREASLPASSIVLGGAMYLSTAIAWPISRASLNFFYWLATSIAGSAFGANPVYWSSSWYIYVLAPIGSAVTALLIVLLFKWMMEMHKKAGEYETVGGKSK